MDHQDHVNLLDKGIPGPGGVWADFGSGGGAFTLALAELLGPAGVIYSLDKDRRALERQHKLLLARFPQITVHYLVGDFTRPLELPPLDGIVSANALHFLRRKEPTLQLLHSYLKPGGRLIVVEYNVERGNPWVPHPFSYSSWQKMAQQARFVQTELLATRPSSFLGEIYSALSMKGEVDGG